MTITRKAVLIAVASLVALASVTTPVAAAPPDPTRLSVEQQIDAQLTAYPGGTRINSNEVAYAGGAFIITFTRPRGLLAAADCPAGWFCFYDNTSYGYPRGKLSSCGWQDLAWWGWQNRTESVHYNLSTGSVAFLNHGADPNHSNDTIPFTTGTGNRTIPDVTPNRNTADHVYRYC